MKFETRRLVHYLIIALGLILIVGGIITGKYGAWIIGLIVAAVNFQQIKKLNKK